MGRRGPVSESHWEQGQQFGNCTGKSGRKLRAKRNITEGRLRLGKNYPSTCRWAQRRKLGGRQERGDWAKERGEPALSWTPSEYIELQKTHSFRPQINSTRWISRYFYLHVRNGKLRYQWSIFPTYLSISSSCFLCTRRTGPFAVSSTSKVPPSTDCVLIGHPPENICTTCPSPPQRCVQRSCFQSSLPDRRMPTSFFLIAHILPTLVIYLLSLCPSIRR